MDESKRNSLASFFLRVGLAAVFFFAAIDSLLNPTEWIGYVPHVLRSIVPVNFLLTAFSIYELALGFWLLTKRYTFYAACLSALTMFVIILGNFASFSNVFRDVAIFFMAVALAVLAKK